MRVADLRKTIREVPDFPKQGINYYDVSTLFRDAEAFRTAIDVMVEENKKHFKRIGLVRYDAFDGIAGQQSYSLCILDDNKNGYVLSNLVGRDFSRSYAIEIANGEAPRKLGQEEGEALRLAVKD